MTDLTSILTKIQSEATGFRSPVGEAILQQLGSSVNGLIDIICPLGTVITNVLTQAELDASVGAGTWKLLNPISGSIDITGSKLATILGVTSLNNQQLCIFAGWTGDDPAHGNLLIPIGMNTGENPSGNYITGINYFIRIN